MHNQLISRVVAVAACGSALLLSASALAQPTPNAAGGATAAAGDSDHAKAVGTFGIGWYGISDIPIGDGFAAGQNGAIGGLNVTKLSAPAIGARYWVSELLGIDAGIGFHLDSGSTETKNGNVTTTTDKPSHFGLLFHVGVPLALKHSGHFTFLVTPEANIGIASGTIKAPAGQTAVGDTDLSGFMLNVGARAGAEIHFGFMGIPQLSLEGSVGLFLQTQSAGAEQKRGNVTVSSSDSDFLITTSSINQPWDFFRSTVAARYYFF